MIELQPATVTINGTTYTAELATVVDTHLGYEDHGIFTAMITFGGPAWQQGLQPRGLGEYDKARDLQAGTAAGLDHIMRIIDVFGVRNWERIKGQRVYVLRRGSFIDGIANADKPDRFMIFADHIKQFYP